MSLVDVHAHMHMKQFEKDLDEVMENAKKKGVAVIINNGLDVESNRKVLELSKKYSFMKSAFGLYPGEKLSDSEIDSEIEWIKSHKPIAIGEVGLDYYHEPYDKEKQIEVFRKMIKLASELDVPIIVHSRKAEKECLDILESENAKKVVLHCFNGSVDLVEKGSARGYYFSIPCIVTFAEQFQKIVKEVNINQLLTETDAPYMSPYKGKRNEPANVFVTVKKIAELKGFEEKETEDTIYMNFQKLFL